MIELAITLGLILIGYGFGRLNEGRHLKRLDRLEEEHAELFTHNARDALLARPGTGVLVTGEVVIASDYFKTLIGQLRNLVGGRMGSYQRLVDRARREAMVRMLEAARVEGCDAVCNIRFETSNIAGAGVRKQAMPMACVLASGTAYKIDDPEDV